MYHTLGMQKIRVAPDTDLAGYLANNFAEYRLSGIGQAGYPVINKFNSNF